MGYFKQAAFAFGALSLISIAAIASISKSIVTRPLSEDTDTLAADDIESAIGQELNDSRLAWKTGGELKVDPDGKIFAKKSIKNPSYRRINPEDGSTIWERKLPDDIYVWVREACLKRENIYFSSNRAFEAISRESGETLWTYRDFSPSFCFFGGEDLEDLRNGVLQFVNARTGEAGVPISVGEGFEIETFNAEIVWGVMDKDDPSKATLFAYDKKSGEELWKRVLREYKASWILKGNNIELYSDKNKILLDGRTGEEIENQGNYTYDSLDREPFIVQKAACEVKLNALTCREMQTKSELWTVNLDVPKGGKLYYPQVAGEHVLLGYEDEAARNGLFLIDLSNGNVLWQKFLPKHYRIAGYDEARFYLTFGRQEMSAAYYF